MATFSPQLPDKKVTTADSNILNQASVPSRRGGATSAAYGRDFPLKTFDRFGNQANGNKSHSPSPGSVLNSDQHSRQLGFEHTFDGPGGQDRQKFYETDVACAPAPGNGGNSDGYLNVSGREQHWNVEGSFGGSPSQFWHVGVNQQSNFGSRGYVLARIIVWPYEFDSSRMFGLCLIKENRAAIHCHVWFVRGGKLIHGGRNRGVLRSVIKDW